MAKHRNDPGIIWEAFLGLWLTFKGFNSSPILAVESREHVIAPAYVGA